MSGDIVIGPATIGPATIGNVTIGDGALEHAIPLLLRQADGRPLIVVTDANVAAAALPRLDRAAAAAGGTLAPIVLPPGEASKSWTTLADLCARLAALGATRDDVILALGGGVVGDVAGLAAALHHRGCPLVQVPTSLLAQVDSSVGGKTAINTPAGKNSVGTFHPPQQVIVDPSLLATLPDRELRAGYAEVVKHGLIDDAPFFDWCETHGAAVLAGDAAARRRAIAHCIAAKTGIVARDPDDRNGTRALLNLGHSFAHGFEALALDGVSASDAPDALRHGEAVAVGLVLAFAYSARLGLCDPADARRIAAHLRATGLPTAPDAIGVTASAQDMLDAMARDKKAVGGTLTLVLARGIGRAFLARGIDRDDLLAFLRTTGLG